MKFLTLEDGQLGALVGETVVDLVSAAATLSVDIQAGIQQLGLDLEIT